MNVDCFLDWNSLSSDEKWKKAREWNVYEREGLEYVVLAGAKLVRSSDVPILDIQAGVYHGTWVIHAFVEENKISLCPPNFELIVDSFQVVWISYPFRIPDEIPNAKPPH